MMNSMKLALLASALLVIPAATASAAMTADECSTLLKKYDTNNDGAIGKAEDSKRFEEAMTKTSIKTKNADTVAMDEFMTACEKGTFDGM